MTNDEVITKVGKLHMALRDANTALFNALDKAILPLIEHQGDLDGMSAAEIARIKGVGAKSAELIFKLISGENIHSLIKNLPKRKEGRLGECKWKW